ncbi:hypothetical protein D9Q98_001678 [Chlorella vulgaris]|uniref:RRM Nup35-type domain-containing protein n=1 Tax=Chlorella vulgaris TaxID=3077 RepID=A0A9D4Z0H5_CHLVU|nr:hypothetical protein D9Q98_001678 [Chlorella vulgaris]
MAAAPERSGTAVSLLFTPTAKAPVGQAGHSPGDFRSFSGLGRTPAGSGRAFGGSAAAGPTPTSRRRSLTPASSKQQDTPPPPPMDSLLDSPGGLGPSSAGWSPGNGEDMQVSTSPYAAAATGQELVRAVRAVEGLEDTWVTVFGFAQADLPLVIREFSKAGNIQQFGTFGEAAHVNWVHIEYQNKHAMQRALLRNGEQLSASCMVGVKPLDAEHRAAITMVDVAGPTFAMTVPKPQQQRPYALGAAASTAGVVPLATKGLTQRVREFILGQ